MNTQEYWRLRALVSLARDMSQDAEEMTMGFGVKSPAFDEVRPLIRAAGETLAVAFTLIQSGEERMLTDE